MSYDGMKCMKLHARVVLLNVVSVSPKISLNIAHFQLSCIIFNKNAVHLHTINIFISLSKFSIYSMDIPWYITDFPLHNDFPHYDP